MNLDDVRLFAEVARRGSYARAAEVVGVARSTLSRIVQRLEVELGAALLHRTTRRVELTPAGARFLERVSPALRELERAAAELASERDEPVGELTVSTTSDVAVSLLAPVVADLLKHHPRLRIRTVLTLRPVDLVGEQVDVALRAYASGPTDPTLMGTRLGSLAFGWFASPSYLARHGAPRTESELDDHVVAMSGPRDPPPRARIDDSLFGLALAKAGGGIGLMPEELCAEDVARGALVRVLPEISVRTGQLWLVYPPGATSPKLAAFVDAVTRRVASGGRLV